MRKTGLDYDELLALIDLPFVNPARDIAIEHLDASCDTTKKVIQGLDEAKLDRMHRLLRLWRKLRGVQLWELDLAIRCPGVGQGTLDEPFLSNFYHVARLRERLGPQTTLEQICALFAELSVETYFTAAHAPRRNGLYQQTFLDRAWGEPQPALAVEAVDAPPPTAETISGHRAAIAAGLGVEEADLDVFTGITRASDGSPYVDDDLTRVNLSVLWRHSWLAKHLKYQARDWKTILGLLQRDLVFTNAHAALAFVEAVDHLRNTDFTPDQLNWLLAANATTANASQGADTTRFLRSLRSDLQATRQAFDPAQVSFLDPPAAVEKLTDLLTSLLLQLHRDDADARLFVETVADTVKQELTVPDLPAGFDFPAAITGAPNGIPIRYEPMLHFAGTMTPAQRTLLLSDPSLATVSGLASYQQAIQTLFTTPGSAAPIGDLPAGFAFPPAITGAPNHIPIRYRPLLRFAGLMTTAQRGVLLTAPSLATVSGIASYQQAIGEMFDAPRLALKFFDPVFVAPLQHLPAAIDFATLPEARLSQRITYDAEQRLLQASGRLAPADKDALDALSADIDYRHAVNTLYTQPALPLPPEKGWLSDAELAFPLRDLTNPAADNLPNNLATAVKRGLTYLAQTRCESLAIQRAASQLHLTEPMAQRLLTAYAILPATLLAHLTGAFAETLGVVDEISQKTTFDGWYWASRVAEIWNRWKLTLAEWEQLSELTLAGQLLDWSALPLDATGAAAPIDRVLRTSRLLRLRARTPEHHITVLALLKRLNAGAYTTPAAFATDVQRCNEAWSATDIEEIVATFDLTFPNDYLLAETWERIRHAFTFSENLGGDIQQAKTFAAATMGPAEAKALAALLRAKFGNETWQILSTEIQDLLRERKRDALVAYLLTQPSPADAPSGKWDNPNDLYAYYLLDVEMNACQLTSRLVQASGSVQLFVQRCFMGLEPEVRVEADGPNGDGAWSWWQWMRKYRVWEANIKVWLWPENWILPELKKDRSSFFKDLENELLQNDVNALTSETAFANYLEKLDAVAQLEIAGFYHEDDAGGARMHVFGRTTGAEPHVYYYRCFNYRCWTPWEKVDLDLQGDYLIPAVVNKRLFLFWPVLTELPDEEENSAVPTPTAGQANVTVHRARKRLRLHMAVSDYRAGTWTPKRISTDHIDSTTYDEDIVRSQYVFFPCDRTDIDESYVISVSGHSVTRDGSARAYLWGAFDVSGCKGVPTLADSQANFRHLLRPEREAVGWENRFLQWRELDARVDAPENDLSFESAVPLGAAPGTPALPATTLESTGVASVPQLVQILRQTPWLFSVTPPWNLSYLDKLLDDGMHAAGLARLEKRGVLVGSWLPQFYSDRKRTFCMFPVAESRREREKVISTRAYYPDVSRKIRQLDGTIEGWITGFVGSIDLSGFSPSQRQQVETSLASQFPSETIPPFTDTQLRHLLVRYFLRYFHLFLGAGALALFQQRKFHFCNFYHPFVCDFAKRVNDPRQGIAGLMKRKVQLQENDFDFAQIYQPTPWVLRATEQHPYPQEIVDFTPDGAYASYNWELFFHAPLLIANALSKNQRFEEARDWYHFIFNPIGIESAAPGGSPMSKFWVTKPFFETTTPAYVQQRIDNIMHLLAGDTNAPGYAPEALKALEDQVRDWRANPFEPHKIASYRTVAYQKTVVMNYLDNLIAWGDHLFRQDSMESINEATQLYILAAEILGTRPKHIPPAEKPQVETFQELQHQLGVLPNALVAIENLVPALDDEGVGPFEGPPLPQLYFCIPHHEKMLGYWDTVADRLYKIRHCMNSEGVVRQLALFEPPIDPGALVKAVAAGVDIGAALQDLGAPLPLYRFQILVRKAIEICDDVKALGAALLTALEKRDAEGLGLLRQRQERRLTEAVKAVREQQIAEAEEHLASLQKNRELADIKRSFYGSREFMNAGETVAVGLNAASTAVETGIAIGYTLAGGLKLMPSFLLGASGFGGSPHATAETGASPSVVRPRTWFAPSNPSHGRWTRARRYRAPSPPTRVEKTTGSCKKILPPKSSNSSIVPSRPRRCVCPSPPKSSTTM